MPQITVTRLAYANQIRSWLGERNLLLLGIGGQRPWEIESQPPLLDEGLTSLPDLIGFVPIRLITPVIESPEGNLILNSEERFFRIETLDPYELAQAGVRKLFIEASINGAKLPGTIDSYRTVGIYQNCVCDEPIFEADQFIPRNRVTEGYLDTIVSFEPVLRDVNVVHTVTFVREL